jgi:hypothetical protein
MNTIDICDLQSLVSAGQIIWTEHQVLRMRERGIKRADVIAAIQSGEIIEQYPDDMPFPSCLVLGHSESGAPLHIVCGLNQGMNCCMITAYHPTPDKWEHDDKTRKAGD